MVGGNGATHILAGLGEVADLANVAIHLARGNNGEALVSLAAMIPFAGAFATLGKFAQKGGKAIGKNTDNILVAVGGVANNGQQIAVAATGAGAFVVAAIYKKGIKSSTPACNVLTGTLKREFPSEYLGNSLDEIKEMLKMATGADKKKLQVCKKLLEQSGRLMEKL